jgi:hypothetical protein
MIALTRRQIAAMLLLPAMPAMAQAPATADPLDTLRKIYSGPRARDAEPFSRRLNALYQATIKRSRELNEPVEGLDFEYSTNAQDHEPGTYASVRMSLLARAGAKAKAKVTFKNGGPQELHYELVLEGGVWLVDDITSHGEQKWRYSQMLRKGAATPKT